MAYTRKTWECGDIVTAEALNNLEGGVEEALECCGSGGSEPLLVEIEIERKDTGAGHTYVVTNTSINKTNTEIIDALQSNKLVLAEISVGDLFVDGDYWNYSHWVLSRITGQDDGSFYVWQTSATVFSESDARYAWAIFISWNTADAEPDVSVSRFSTGFTEQNTGN